MASAPTPTPAPPSASAGPGSACSLRDCRKKLVVTSGRRCPQMVRVILSVGAGVVAFRALCGRRVGGGAAKACGGLRRGCPTEGIRGAVKVCCESAAAKELEAGLLAGRGDVSVIPLCQAAHDPADVHRRGRRKSGRLLEETFRRRFVGRVGGREKGFREGGSLDRVGRSERPARVLPPGCPRVRTPAFQHVRRHLTRCGVEQGHIQP